MTWLCSSLLSILLRMWVLDSKSQEGYLKTSGPVSSFYTTWSNRGLSVQSGSDTYWRRQTQIPHNPCSLSPAFLYTLCHFLSSPNFPCIQFVSSRIGLPEWILTSVVNPSRFNSRFMGNLGIISGLSGTSLTSVGLELLFVLFCLPVSLLLIRHLSSA